MILIISVCNNNLSESEFVKPIAKIAEKNYEIKHYTETIDFKKYRKIIISGTALKDNYFLNNLDKFNWIKKTNLPLLGICSGMQIIALKFGARLIKRKEIGMAKINLIKKSILFDNDFEAYELHGNSLVNLYNFNIMAKSEKSVQAIKHKKKAIYGIIFHPEVKNEQIIHNFIKANI